MYIRLEFMNEKFLTIPSNFNHEIIFNQINVKLFAIVVGLFMLKWEDSLNWLTQPSKVKKKTLFSVSFCVVLLLQLTHFQVIPCQARGINLKVCA